MEYNIEIGLQEIGRSVVDWINLTEDREQWRAVVTTVMNTVVP